MKKSLAKTKRNSNIVELEHVRARLRLVSYQTKVANILADNKEAIDKLYSTGAIFSFHGAKAARELLLVHQNLLRIVTLLNRVSARELRIDAQHESEASSVFKELDGMLARTHRIAHKTGTYLTRLKTDS